MNRPRSCTKDPGRFVGLITHFGDRFLDQITPLDIEQFRDALLARGLSQATANRRRALLSGLFKRALRDRHISANPVQAVQAFKENNARIVYLMADEEQAILDALPAVYRPHFLVSIHTGLRWSEQMGLRWRDVDILTRIITIVMSKNGQGRRVPMNSVTRPALLDLATRRLEPDNPYDWVFVPRPRQSGDFFPQAVQRARESLRAAGKDATRLEGYTWHGNRHTFASRLVMAGVDLRTVQELGGWKTMSMVQRYSHLAPDHLRAAVERLALGKGQAACQAAPGSTEVSRKYDLPNAAAPEVGGSVEEAVREMREK